jgi:hypothetical protein
MIRLGLMLRFTLGCALRLKNPRRCLFSQSQPSSHRHQVIVTDLMTINHRHQVIVIKSPLPTGIAR